MRTNGTELGVTFERISVYHKSNNGEGREAMFICLGWIVAALLAGVLLGLSMKHRKTSLQKRVFQMGVFAGRSYAEILRTLVGPHMVVRQANGQTLRTWRNRDYSHIPVV